MTFSRMSSWRLLCVSLIIGLLNGCAQAPIVTADDSEQGATIDSCLALYQTMDRRLSVLDSRDAQYYPVKGFPFLRIDRLYASLAEEINTDEEFFAWSDQLRRFDLSSRELEWRNLPSEERPSDHQQNQLLPAAFFSCSETLLKEVRQSQSHRMALLAAAKVPDSYSTTQQVLGVYPLTAWFVASGISRFQREQHAVFASPIDKLETKGTLQRFSLAKSPPYAYAPPRPAEWQRNALGLPAFTEFQLRALFDYHAPIFEIDVAASYDKPGLMALGDQQRGTLPSHNAVYLLPSFTQFEGEILLQLNYMIWFGERPARSLLDIYAGQLDGLIWRVTLSNEGEPILYESVHACGCYLKFYPVSEFVKQTSAPQSEEPPLVLQQLDRLESAQRRVVRISSGEHFVQRVYTDRRMDGVTLLDARNYDELRSLPKGEGYQSLFRADGLVEGSERLERFIFWPMGVSSTGAMRQWGHHATAFIGRRHFDDPKIIERYFGRPLTRVPHARGDRVNTAQ